jgi:hypothetical protein
MPISRELGARGITTPAALGMAVAARLVVQVPGP